MDRDSDREPLMESHGGDEDIDIHDEEQSAFDYRPGYNRTQGRVRSKEQEDAGKPGLAEEPPVVAPSLRSTMQSREMEYDMDEDDLDEAALAQLSHARTHSGLGDVERSGQSMPLLVGLLDTANLRNSATTRGISMENGGHGGEEVDLEELAKKRTAGGSIVDSVANMANAILGAGIIGLPYAIAQAGFVTGLTLLVVLCLVTDWTIRLIVINAKMSGQNSYIGMMSHCFGATGRATVSLFQFSFAFGGMCAFGIIIGDTIPHVLRYLIPPLKDTFLTNRQFIIALCTTCISYPLSLYRDISKLARASAFALVGMVIIVISVIVQSERVAPELRGDPTMRFTFINQGIFQAIGVISFAFVCHHNSLLIYGDLRTPTIDRFALVTHISTAISFVSCLTLAVAGYVVFTDKTQGNILNNFPADDLLINIARFCFGFNMFTTLPLELFVCREVIEQYFFSHEPWNKQRHVLFTTVLLFSSMFVALITCDLGVVLEVAGGVAASALAFIFPAGCYLQQLPASTPWTSRTKLPAVNVVAFGKPFPILRLSSQPLPRAPGTESRSEQPLSPSSHTSYAFYLAETAETYVKETSESSKSLSHHSLVAALVVLRPVRAQELPAYVDKSSTARFLSPQLYLIPHIVSLAHSIQPPARRSSSIAPLLPVASTPAMTVQVAPLDLAAPEPYDTASSSTLRWISWGSNEHAAFLGVPSTAFQPLVPPAPAKPPAAIDPKQKHAQKVFKPKSTHKGSSPSAKPSAGAPYVSSVARRKQHFTHPSPSASTTSLSSVHSPITSDSLTTSSIATNASSRMPELAHVGVIDIKFLSTQKLPKGEKEKLKEKPKDVLAETPEPPATPPPVPSVKRRGGAARAGATTTAGGKAAPTGKGKGRRKSGARNEQNDEDDEDKEKKEREVQLFRFLPPSQQPTSGPYIRYSPMYHPYHPFRSMHREAVKNEMEERNPPPKPEPVVEKEVEEPPAPQRRQSSRQKKQATRLTAAEKKEKAKEAKERAKERAKEKALKAKEAAKEKAKEASNSKAESKETLLEREPSPPVVATRSRAAAAAAKTAAASKSKSSGNAHTAPGDSKADAKSNATKGRASRATTAGAKRKREEDEEQATEEVTPPPKRPRRGAATRSANAQNGNGSNDALDGDEHAQDNASQEGSSNENLEEHSASSPTGDPPSGDKPPQRRMRPGTRKTQAARAAAMAAKKRSLAERGNKSPGDESMELDQDGVEDDVSLKVEAIEEKEVVPDAAAAASSPPPSTATPTAPAPSSTPKARGRGGKSRGGVSRGRASTKRRTGVRNAKAPQKEAEEEHTEEHEAEPVEERVEESQENGTGVGNEENPPGEAVAAVKADE